MSDKTLSILSCFSVLIPFYFGCVLFKKIDREYYPFVFFIFAITLSDLTRAFLTFFAFHNNWVSNINILVESYLITWTFQRWGLYQNRRKIAQFLFYSYIPAFLVDIILFPGQHFIYYFSVLYASILSFQSISMVNKLSRTEIENLHTHPKFIISAGFIIYFAIQQIPIPFLSDLVKTTKAFKLALHDISNIAVSLTYCIFSYGLILMPRRHRKSNYKAQLVLEKGFLT